MEAASASETLVNFYQTARCNNPEDSNLHTRRRENLKSHVTIQQPQFVQLTVKVTIVELLLDELATLTC
jgi:hypothetical protein